MPYYFVLMHGKGIYIPDEEDEKPIVGFYTTRLVKVDIESQAEIIAKNMVIQDWSSGEYFDCNKGHLPTITVESVSKACFLKRLNFKNTGHVFYAHE